MRFLKPLLVAALLAATTYSFSQDMPGMKMPAPSKTQPAAPAAKMDMDMAPPSTFIQSILQHESSGTSAEPVSTPMSMLMTHRSGWQLMLHGEGFLADTQQHATSNPVSPFACPALAGVVCPPEYRRGADKLFSTNWIMPMAQHKLGARGQLTVRTMLSLEPATITHGFYPELFQQGETANGNPIVDGQHPHDFIMELAAIYDLHLGENTLLSFYAAPVGDPAIGPTAYPHRQSASEDPIAALGHHQEDSTHIVNDVVAVGFTHSIARIEASGFYGREPDEHRWNIDQGTIDSWSPRLTVQPGQNWSWQYSYGRIKSPEALFPSEDQERMTASIMYNKPLIQGNWANAVLWGRTRSLGDSAKENSYLLDSTLRFKTRNYVWTRIENAGRSNELLNGENPLPANFQEGPLTHVQAYTFGYDRDVDLIPHVASAIGAEVTAYGVGKPLQPIYGTDPVGINIFVRLRPFSKDQR